MSGEPSKKVVAREQCPKCLDTGADNVAVYEDGKKYCFGCALPIYTDAVLELTPKQPFVEGEISEIKTRGLTYETCKFFDYRIGKFNNEWVQIANYFDTKGCRVAQKIRFPTNQETGEKRFFVTGDSKRMSLYGQWRWTPNDKLFVTVVEGEIDAMSLAQIQGYQFPVVSIPLGANKAKGEKNSAYKALKENLKWLLGFKYVVLALDDDETGNISTKECLSLFEPGRVKVAKFPLKDVNEMLMAYRAQEVKFLLFNAKEYRPENIVTVENIMDKILNKPEWGTPQPWVSLDNTTYGVQFKEIHIIVAANGIGKTEYVKELMFHYLDQGLKIGLFSFEQDPDNTIRRLVGSKLGVKLHIPGSTWNVDQVRQVALDFNHKVYLYDKAGSADLDEIFNSIRYLAVGRGVKVFIIDNLKGLKIVNDRERAELLMTKIQTMKNELNITIILLSHVTKDKHQTLAYVSTSPKNREAYAAMTSEETSKLLKKDGMDWESGRQPSKENVEGPSIVCDLADYVFSLARNTTSDDTSEAKTLRVKILKARLDSSNTGHVFKLYYNDAGRYEELNAPISGRKDGTQFGTTNTEEF